MRADHRTDGKQRAAMEGIFKGYDAALVRAEFIVRIFARQLQRRFVRFAPELQKKTFSAKVASISFFARRNAGSLV